MPFYNVDRILKGALPEDQQRPGSFGDLSNRFLNLNNLECKYLCLVTDSDSVATDSSVPTLSYSDVAAAMGYQDYSPYNDFSFYSIIFVRF